MLQDTGDYFGNGERRTFSSNPAQNLLYTTDHLGSIREAIDKVSGTVLTRYDYSPYRRRTSMGSSGTPIDFGYTGHYTSVLSGLLLAPYRALDVELGRWLSRDPVQERGGVNLHGYVAKFPTGAVDPKGLDRYITGKGIHQGIAVDIWKDGKKVGKAYFDMGPRSYVDPKTGKCAWGKFLGNLVLSVLAGSAEIVEHWNAWPGQTIHKTIASTQEEDERLLETLRANMIGPPPYSLPFNNCRTWADNMSDERTQLGDLRNSMWSDVVMMAF